MAYRTRQFKNDEDLPVNNYRITGIKSLLLNSREAGAVPSAEEILYADSHHQVLKALIRDRLQVGNSNTSILHIKAAAESIDTRSRAFTYTGDRLTELAEKDGANTVKNTVNTLDGYGRIIQSQTTVGGKTITTTITYEGNTEKVASMSRSVV